MVKKTICTTIDEDLWKQSILKGIRWVDIVETGATVLLGSVNKGETDLLKVIDEKQNELDFLRQKLVNMREKSKEDQEKERIAKKSRTVLEFRG